MSEPKQTAQASDEHTAERPISAPLELRGERARKPLSSPHSHKFHAVTAALAGVALGAIVVAVLVLVGGNKSAPTTPWSSWAPDDHGSLGTREIADHLAPLYRISPVDQLAVVTVVNLSSPTVASAAAATTTSTSTSNGLQVAVRADPNSSAVSVLGGKTIAFNLCGIGGTNCSIGVGKPSADRLLLLRREALELALYTFKYIHGVQNVVAILPPGHTTQECTGICSKPPSTNAAVTKPLNAALLFLHDELSPWLSEPLAATLPEAVPPTVTQIRGAPEAGLVEQITARGLFAQNLVQAQDGSRLLVLDPLPPQ